MNPNPYASIARPDRRGCYLARVRKRALALCHPFGTTKNSYEWNGRAEHNCFAENLTSSKGCSCIVYKL